MHSQLKYMFDGWKLRFCKKCDTNHEHNSVISKGRFYSSYLILEKEFEAVESL